MNTRQEPSNHLVKINLFFILTTRESAHRSHRLREGRESSRQKLQSRAQAFRTHSFSLAREWVCRSSSGWREFSRSGRNRADHSHFRSEKLAGARELSQKLTCRARSTTILFWGSWAWAAATVAKGNPRLDPVIIKPFGLVWGTPRRWSSEWQVDEKLHTQIVRFLRALASCSENDHDHDWY